jgi:hypothetical protein
MEVDAIESDAIDSDRIEDVEAMPRLFTPPRCRSLMGVKTEAKSPARSLPHRLNDPSNRVTVARASAPG